MYESYDTYTHLPRCGRALAGAGSTTAQSGLGLKGGFSYGNVSNRGLLPGNLTERTSGSLITRTCHCSCACCFRHPVSLHAYAGPQVSFELRCRAGSSPCPDTDRPSTSYAAVIGGGARLGASSAFTVEGRYVYGLTDLKLNTITSSESYKTRSFLILAGWAF